MGMHWQGLAERVGRDPVIARFGQDASFRVLVREGRDERLIEVRGGKVTDVTRGPFVMPQCDFALTGSADAWARFVRPLPAPRDQDLFAFFRRGEIELTGDTRKFYAQLLVLKLVLIKLREAGGES